MKNIIYKMLKFLNNYVYPIVGIICLFSIVFYYILIIEKKPEILIGLAVVIIFPSIIIYLITK